jgi:ornithine decarboxylase
MALVDMAHRQSDDPKHSPSARRPEAVGVSEKIDRFLATQRPHSPCVIIDLDVVCARYAALRDCFPDANIFYAVKANPAAEVLATLASADARFDLASEGEINRCRALGIAADRLSFGNTIKRETEIVHAHRRGIDRFAFDSIGEVEKIARSAPGAQVFCRMLIDAKGADWPLTRAAQG